MSLEMISVTMVVASLHHCLCDTPLVVQYPRECIYLLDQKLLRRKEQSAMGHLEAVMAQWIAVP